MDETNFDIGRHQIVRSKMPELGPMMRALELQRVIEDKVAEWRERSARVAGATVAESYQQPLNFKRHTHRRKNSAEINRIIAKYSKPYKRTDEPDHVTRDVPGKVPTRPPRHKKLSVTKGLSKSEDNLAAVGVMETVPDKIEHVKPPFNISKYKTKSCEDVTAFVDVHHSMKSKNFEQHSILNAKVVPSNSRLKLHSISEDISVVSELTDSGFEVRDKSSFITSTPISKRKTCPVNSSLTNLGVEKCSIYTNSVNDLRKGRSEPDILGANKTESMDGVKTIDWRKRWRQLKPPFKKGTFDCLLLWRGRRPRATVESSRR